MKDKFSYLLEDLRSSYEKLDLENYISTLEDLNNFLEDNYFLEKIKISRMSVGTILVDIRYSFNCYKENQTSYFILNYEENLETLRSLKKFGLLGKSLLRSFYRNIDIPDDLNNKISNIVCDIYKGKKFSVKENKFFIDNRPIKRGKFLKHLGYNTVQIDMILSTLDGLFALERSDLSYSKNITGIYSRAIKTCMSNKDLSVLEEVDIQVCSLMFDNTTLARTLIYDNKYKSSCVYSSSTYIEDNGISDLEKLPDNYRTKWIKGHPMKRFIPYMDDLPYVIYSEKRDAFCFARGDKYKKLANYVATSTEGFLSPNVEYIENHLSSEDTLMDDFVYRGEITKDEVLELGYCKEGIGEWLEKHNLPDKFCLSDLVRSFIHHDTSISQIRVRMCRDLIEKKIEENL